MQKIGLIFSINIAFFFKEKKKKKKKNVTDQRFYKTTLNFLLNRQRRAIINRSKTTHNRSCFQLIQKRLLLSRIQERMRHPKRSFCQKMLMVTFHNI